MAYDVLQKLVETVSADPHNGGSLGLYALASTLKMENTGYLYTLRKLRDLDPGQRQLAYELMELMAQQGNRGDAWETALQAMDEAVRKG